MKAKQVVVSLNGESARCGHDHPDHYSALPCTRMAKKLAEEGAAPGIRVAVRQEPASRAVRLRTTEEVWGWRIPYNAGQGRPSKRLQQSAVESVLQAALQLVQQADREPESAQECLVTAKTLLGTIEKLIQIQIDSTKQRL